MRNAHHLKITMVLILGLAATSCFAEVEELEVNGADAAARAAAEDMGRRYAEGQALAYARQRGYESMLQAQAAAEQARLREQLRVQAEADLAKTRPERVKQCQQNTVTTMNNCMDSAVNSKKGHMSYCNYLIGVSAASGAVAATAVVAGATSALPTAGAGAAAGGTVAGIAGGASAIAGGAAAICINQADSNYAVKENQCAANERQNTLNCNNMR